MDKFKNAIRELLKSNDIETPWVDIEVLVDDTYDSALKYVMTNMADELLLDDDRELFKNSYLTTPNGSNALGFLQNHIDDFEDELDTYFNMWIEIFKVEL